MRIQKLLLKNFRNYQEQEIAVASGTNVFIGENAQGKTNILEAIYMCTCARSHRTGKDTELIKDEEDFYQIFVEYISEQNLQQSIKIEYKIKPRLQRTIYYCGLKQEKISDFFGLFHAVIFAPEDLMLIKEGPAVRRRFLDVFISQIKPLYFKKLQMYQQYLKQRNYLLKILKDIDMEGNHKKTEKAEENYQFNLIQLDIWTEKIAEVQAAIIKIREEYVRKIGDSAGKYLEKISEGKEKLSIKYKTIAGIDIQASAVEIEQKLRKRYTAQKKEDIYRGNTASGIHRDDIELYVNQNLLKERGSQGQQRSAVLALKLAELEILEKETGEKPVLLLDDVMSELDERRRKHLLQAFEENQVFITCTDLSQIYPSVKASLIDGEQIEKKSSGKEQADCIDTTVQINGTEKPQKGTEKPAAMNAYINFYQVAQGTVKRQFLL